MEKAIVTGASSGIGAATASVLLKSGYEVYGIGRDFAGQSELLEAPLFHERICDLKKHADVKKEIEAIKSEAGQISILVNCAGVGYFGPHEQVNPDKIHEMVAVNIEAPMIITGLLLRDMKKNGGIIINISSVTAKKSNTYGCAYGATKAALTSFGESLFDEARKYGVKVVNIHPDMTQSQFTGMQISHHAMSLRQDWLRRRLHSVLWELFTCARGRWSRILLLSLRDRNKEKSK